VSRRDGLFIPLNLREGAGDDDDGGGESVVPGCAAWMMDLRLPLLLAIFI